MRFLPPALTAALAVTLAAPHAHAQTPATPVARTTTAAAPSFGGTWEINAAKSDFGQFPAPTKYTMTIEQTATTLKSAEAMATPQGDVNTSTELSLEGKETTGTGFAGSTTKNVAKVDGGALVVDTKLSMQGNEMTQTSKWTLSPDGKQLTIVRSLNGPMGALSFTIVLDKKS